MKCRHCQTNLEIKFADLGVQPISNNYLTENKLREPQTFYPLEVFTCSSCYLTQTTENIAAEVIFDDDYAYFSSTSKSWLQHASDFTYSITRKFNLSKQSFVLEIASNDGYLLKNFLALDIPCLGVEPTKSTATAAKNAGIAVIEDFFSHDLAKTIFNEHGPADLIIANNVIAHVPDINDFVRGMSELVERQKGVITIEFPHLLNLIKYNQFDTIYHEHYSYLSLTALLHVIEKFDLKIFDVECLNTHGGSLRAFLSHKKAQYKISPNVKRILSQEISSGLLSPAGYSEFQKSIEKVRNDTLKFLITCKEEGKKVAGYGAAAKGNTLLNFCGIKYDLLPYVCDKSEAKQGKYLPGSRIPIKHPDHLTLEKPDYLIILPWNLQSEIIEEMNHMRRLGCKFVTFVPELEIVE